MKKKNDEVGVLFLGFVLGILMTVVIGMVLEINEAAHEVKKDDEAFVCMEYYESGYLDAIQDFKEITKKEAKQ